MGICRAIKTFITLIVSAFTGAKVFYYILRRFSGCYQDPKKLKQVKTKGVRRNDLCSPIFFRDHFDPDLHSRVCEDARVSTGFLFLFIYFFKQAVTSGNQNGYIPLQTTLLFMSTHVFAVFLK